MGNRDPPLDRGPKKTDDLLSETEYQYDHVERGYCETSHLDTSVIGGVSFNG